MKTPKNLIISTIVLIIIFTLTSQVQALDLAINRSNPGCSDANTRAQAASLSTPWCGVEQIPLKALSGDTIKVYGAYNDENTATITGGHFTSNTTLDLTQAAFNGAIPSVTWNSEGSGIFNTTSIITGSAAVGCFFNNMMVYPYDTYAHMIDNSGNPRGSFWNNTADVLKVRLWASETPTSSNMFCSKADMMQIDDTWNLIVKNGNVSWGTNIIRITDAINVTIDSVFVKGGIGTVAAIRMTTSSNVDIINSTCFQVEATNLSWGMRKDMSEEAASLSTEVSCIMIQTSDDSDALNNTIDGYFNAVMYQVDSLAQIMNRTKIKGNRCVNIGDDCLEIELWSRNIEVTENYGTDIFNCISIAPANCSTANGGNCVVANNSYYCNKTILYNRDTGSTFSPQELKLDTFLGSSTTGWNINHNTLLNATVGWYETDESHSVRDNTVIDNIFSVGNSYALSFTGYASRGEFFDYNIYDKTVTGNPLKHWNNDTGTQASLASALSSAFWDGTWDINSIETGADTGVNLGINNSMFRPNITSPACGNGSGGSDIGSHPCNPFTAGDEDAGNTSISIKGTLIIKGSMNAR